MVMTLKDLIEQAQNLLYKGVSPDAVVFSEGCDCDGEADQLVLNERNDRVRYEDGPLKGQWQRTETGEFITRRADTVLLARK